MDIRLLSQNLLLILCSVLTVSFVYLIAKVDKKRWKQRGVLAILGSALITAFLLEYWVHKQFPTDLLPNFFWLMLLPFTFSVALTIVTWMNKHLWLGILATVTALGCLLFSALLINNYYRFYPTLYSVFNKEERVKQLTQTQRVVLYSTGGSQIANTSESIEGALYKQGSVTAGSVYSLDIPGTISKFKARKAWVYVPAAANDPGGINLPVIVMTPGYPGQVDNWLGSGLQATMDHFAAFHHGITPYVFMVDNTGSLTNDTECVDSPRGNVETYLSQDVPNYIKTHFSNTVSTSANNWAIGGLSMGGMCAAMITLRHTDVYHYFLDLGGEMGPEVGSKQKTIATLFGGSETNWDNHQLLTLLRKRYNGIGGYFAVGREDSRPLINGLKTLYQQAHNAGIESIYEEAGGQHTFDVWQQTFKDSLPWLSNRLGATECAATCGQ